MYDKCIHKQFPTKVWNYVHTKSSVFVMRIKTWQEWAVTMISKDGDILWHVQQSPHRMSDLQRSKRVSDTVQFRTARAMHAYRVCTFGEADPQHYRTTVAKRRAYEFRVWTELHELLGTRLLHACGFFDVLIPRNVWRTVPAMKYDGNASMASMSASHHMADHMQKVDSHCKCPA